ncbi:tyrosine-type recombinase/integrase (plasmid) [Entomospira entomophila]|uniref:Tyrosine-type recombinase/integrase n=1 Tax=Entomospira entomophila TaxID=2719988 RepID=A0A968KUK8_9SPIO|nr:tyrosine-type recombinase/integrase [Entomospira entomophilus]NIZ41581.1 tyrosine-type recombinase/integrase [Entomospira entomophilus]WDI36482.1 tyrosine-type recombinase/integrase [Entomospira entomophilus]
MDELTYNHALLARKTISQTFALTDLSCKEVTEKSYQKQISYFLSELGSQPISMLHEAIKAFITQERASASTKKIRQFALLKYFKTVLEDSPLERAKIEQYIKAIPIEKKATLALNEEQALTLDQVNFIKRLPLTLKQQACFLGLLETGLRASELLSIKLSDIQPSNHSQAVSMVKVLGKGNKTREIYLNNEIIELAKSAYQGSTYLFEGDPKNGKPAPINYQTLHATVKAIGKKAGLKKVLHPHMLRHTFATLALKHGKKSIKAISTYLGHASTAITQDVYMHDNFEAKDFEDI